jgi:uncharacterized membrane protein YedE/YeeE
MRHLAAALCGALFGLGLMVSGMTDTRKVQGWLDVFGDWDPTLAFVLGGALVPTAIAWAWMARRGASLLGTAPPTPSDAGVDRPLLWGAATFGAGWALAGFCPGPAMASLSYGGAAGVTFLAAMVAGMALARPIQARLPALRPG